MRIVSMHARNLDPAQKKTTKQCWYTLPVRCLPVTSSPWHHWELPPPSHRWCPEPSEWVAARSSALCSHLDNEPVESVSLNLSRQIHRHTLAGRDDGGRDKIHFTISTTHLGVATATLKNVPDDWEVLHWERNLSTALAPSLSGSTWSVRQEAESEQL